MNYDKTDFEDLMARADVKELMGKRDESLSILRVAAALDPQRGEAWTRIARIYISAQDIDSAREAVNRGLEHCPNYAELLVEAGVVALMEGELMEAADAFERALDLDERCAEAWAQLGVIHLALEELEEASKVLAQAAELAPDRPEFRYQLAMVQLSRGDTNAAEGELLKIATHLPDSSSVQLDLAVMEMSGGRYGEALARLDELLRNDPINVRAKFYRYVAVGHIVQGIEFQKEEIEKDFVSVHDNDDDDNGSDPSLN